MTNEEVLKLLAAIGAVDGRRFDEGSVGMWRSVLAEVRPNEREFTFDECWQAIPRWFAANDGFMSPRALIAEVRAGRERLAEKEHHALVSGEESWKAEPQPICKAHDLPILDCDDCCAVLSSQVGHLYGERLHSWACVNLYRKDSLVGAEVF